MKSAMLGKIRGTSQVYYALVFVPRGWWAWRAKTGRINDSDTSEPKSPKSPKSWVGDRAWDPAVEKTVLFGGEAGVETRVVHALWPKMREKR